MPSVSSEEKKMRITIKFVLELAMASFDVIVPINSLYIFSPGAKTWYQLGRQGHCAADDPYLVQNVSHRFFSDRVVIPETAKARSPTPRALNSADKNWRHVLQPTNLWHIQVVGSYVQVYSHRKLGRGDDPRWTQLTQWKLRFFLSPFSLFPCRWDKGKLQSYVDSGEKQRFGGVSN